MGSRWISGGILGEILHLTTKNKIIPDETTGKDHSFENGNILIRTGEPKQRTIDVLDENGVKTGTKQETYHINENTSFQYPQEVVKRMLNQVIDPDGTVHAPKITKADIAAFVRVVDAKNEVNRDIVAAEVAETQDTSIAL